MNHAWSHGRCINCGAENTPQTNPDCPPPSSQAAQGLAYALGQLNYREPPAAVRPQMQEARIFLINGQMFGISVPAGQMEYQSWWNGVVASGFVYLDDAIIPLASIASVIKGEALKSMIAQMNLMPAGSRMN